MADLLGELKRRNVFRMAVIYVVTAWVILQVADVFFPALRLPEWTLSLVAGLLLLGFPMALVFSWVFEITADGLRRSEEVHPQESITSQTGRRLNSLIIGSLVIAVAILLVRQHQLQSATKKTTGPTGNSVAVLPFVNLSDDPAASYFSDGIAEELLNALMELPDIDVVSRTSSFSYRDQGVDLREIGRQLDATHILEGSVRLSGDQVRIKAQLVNAADGYSLWSNTYTTPLSDVFLIQEQIGRSIADALQLELLPDNLAALGRRSTEKVATWDLHTQAQALRRAANTVEEFQAAIDLFDNALRRDPLFAAAEAGKCQAQFSQYWLTRDRALITAAIETCDRAAIRNPQQPEVQAALGRLYRGTGRTDLAIAAYREALRVAPDNYDAVLGLADALAEADDLAAAEIEFQRAIEIAPKEPSGPGHYGAALAVAGRLQESVPFFERALSLEPENSRYHANLGGVYTYLGEFAKAAALYRRAAEIAPSPSGYANAGTNYYYIGDYMAAVDMYQRAIEVAPHDYRWRGNLADACRQMTEACPTPAEQLYQRALDLVGEHLAINPEDAVAESLRALYLVRLGQSDRARMRLQRAIELDGADVNVRWMEALVRAGLGDLDGASTALQGLVQLGVPLATLRADPDLGEVFDYLAASEKAI